MRLCVLFGKTNIVYKHIYIDSIYKENISKANNILELYLEKILSLNIGSIMMKEMSELAAEEVYNKLNDYTATNLDKLLNKCISILRIG